MVIIIMVMSGNLLNAVNRGAYISDNLPFLLSLNDECVGLVCIDPPPAKSQAFGRKNAWSCEPPDGFEWRVPSADIEAVPAPALHPALPDMSTVVKADFADLLSQVASDSVDLVLTDPPYTISKKTGFKHIGANSVERLAVDMDFGEWDKTRIDLSVLATLTYRALRRGGTAIIWYDLWKLSHLSEAMIEAGFKQLRLLVWQKTNPVPLNQSVNYLNNSREIAVLGVKVGKPTFNAKYHSGVFEEPIPRDGGKRLHPTQKPLRIFRELIRIHSNAGDLVVDPFLGSGTTAVAALGQGRRFTGGDIDTRYVAIAEDRIHREVYHDETRGSCTAGRVLRSKV